MASATFRNYLDRSARYLRNSTERVVKMDAFIQDTRKPLALFSFDSTRPPVDPVYDFSMGTDADIGGYSTCSLTEVPYPSSSSSSSSAAAASSTSTGLASQSHLAFHGNLSLKVPPEQKGRMRSGFATFRNKNRTTLFGEDHFDLGTYTHLRVEVAYRGLEAWRGRWYCNVQMNRDVSTDLFQHRLDLPPSPTPSSSSLEPSPDPMTAPPPIFHTLHLALSSFNCLSNTSSLDRPDRIRSIGFSLLGTRHGDIFGGAPPPLSAVLDEVRRRGDAELEEMVRGDLEAAEERKGMGLEAAAVGGGGGDVGPETEGYFELCVRKVEAVKWDPEKEAEEGLL